MFSQAKATGFEFHHFKVQEEEEKVFDPHKKASLACNELEKLAFDPLLFCRILLPTGVPTCAILGYFILHQSYIT